MKVRSRIRPQLGAVKPRAEIWSLIAGTPPHRVRGSTSFQQALWIVGDPIFHSPQNRVPELAAQAGLPSIYLVRNLVQAGGLISYGPDFPGDFDVVRFRDLYSSFASFFACLMSAGTTVWVSLPATLANIT